MTAMAGVEHHRRDRRSPETTSGRSAGARVRVTSTREMASSPSACRTGKESQCRTPLMRACRLSARTVSDEDPPVALSSPFSEYAEWRAHKTRPRWLASHNPVLHADHLRFGSDRTSKNEQEKNRDTVNRMGYSENWNLSVPKTKMDSIIVLVKATQGGRSSP